MVDSLARQHSVHVLPVVYNKIQSREGLAPRKEARREEASEEHLLLGSCWHLT